MAWVGAGWISPIATRLLLLPRRPCRGPARLMRTQSRRRRGLPRSAATPSPSLLAPHLRSPRLSTWAPIYSAGFVFIGSRWPLPWGGGGRFSSLPWPAVRALQIDMKEKRLFLLFLLINIGIQAGGGRRRRMVSIGVSLLLYEAVPAPVPVYFPPRFLLRLQTVQRLQTFPCFPCCFLTKKKTKLWGAEHRPGALLARGKSWMSLCFGGVIQLQDLHPRKHGFLFIFLLFFFSAVSL